MKKMLLSLAVITSLTACSQVKDEMAQNKNINANNIVEEITKHIKHYPSEKQYTFTYNNQRCYFEILVNDMPSFKEYEEDQTGSAFPINDAIFKTGKQKISFKIYPAGSEVLPENTDLKLILSSYDQKDKNADDITYMEYRIPKNEIKVTENYTKHTFAGVGKAFYEGSFEINVEVPYTSQLPFEKAQDLRKIDQKKLEEKLVNEYNKVRNIYQGKDKDKVARLLFDKLKNQMVAEYASPEKVKAAWNEAGEILFKSDFEMLPVEKYQMRFFADGRLVALYADGSDPKTRGDNALICNMKSGYGKGLFELKHLFYIPQGETEFKIY
ncbi:hypothetical protein [Pedobacter alluvionis]|uniref:Uncharacterized protein n=1 Tax=Pedobacter alluvionis TaxID=475253 RepID=A0A497Y0C5_9SPHI|nr:hypothetical protein [Pedobacter alluvionis]RLJ75179.1 hypothetical protein BCL90_3530 [Pedobacter alluvionis]TFB30281.1 hypothetical protein E3V97_19120 [Pedobacter alluvionis]